MKKTDVIFRVKYRIGKDKLIRCKSYVIKTKDGSKHKQHQYTLDPENKEDMISWNMWKELAKDPAMALIYLRTNFGEEPRDNSVSYNLMKRIISGQVKMEVIKL